MNALGASILFILLGTVIFASKRWALMGMVASVMYLTQAQRVDIAGFNLYAARFIELAAFVRVMVRKEFSFYRINKIDFILLLLYIYTAIVFLLRSNEGQAYEIGRAVDALLSYFAFRGLTKNVEDVEWFLRSFIILLLPYAALVLIETYTSKNLFSLLGAVDLTQDGELWFRDGRLRAIGSFGHSSLMGTLGGTFLPVYIGLWFIKKFRLHAILGIVTCLAIVWASNSGGPATCVIISMLGWALWTMRARMQLVRRCLAGSIVLLCLVMKAPIWYLLYRISNFTGGDGWHRSELIDVAFQNIDKWWMVGIQSKETANWLPYTNFITGAVDVTNQFLVFGFTAGLGSIILLVILLTLVFKHLGSALMYIRSDNHASKELEFLYWGIGVMFVVHLFNWFGISYWDQINLVWFMQLAIVSSLKVKTCGVKTRILQLHRLNLRFRY